MIPRSTKGVQPATWLDELRLAYDDPNELLGDLGLQHSTIKLAPNAAGFPFRVPRPYVARMRYGDANDPLLLQVLPRLQESEDTPGYSRDPVGELRSRRGSALLQKYHARALLVVSGGCAINCRYCFRRHFPYAQSVGTSALRRAVGEIAVDTSITEVILSGGDPLLASDDSLAELVAQLEGIKHIRRLRVHTRLPVTIASRVTPGLIDLLASSRLSTSIVVHINHPNEIDSATSAAFAAVRRADVTLFNQSVLLRGVNDDITTLKDLCEKLFDAHVTPYYVHLLDPVAGAAHFDVPEATAMRLARGLREQLPGYLVPRFVREISGEPSKTPLAE